MPHPVFLVLIVFAVLAIAPFLLLRGADDAGADAPVAAGSPPPLPPPPPQRVVQNAGIAYALRGPLLFFFFVWGARGEFWPLLIAAAGAVFLGILALLALRCPLQKFLESNGEQKSFPALHVFLAAPDAEGKARPLQTFAAGLSAFALSGLLVVEALGLAYVLKPMLIFPAPWPDAIAGGVLVLALSCVLLTGGRAALHAAQVQLGLIYLGLFGATAFLLYLLLAAYPPMPPYGVPALAALVLICLALIIYRRSRYVDTSPIGPPRRGPAGVDVVETRGGKLLRRFNKVLNPLLTTILVVIIVFALMGLTAFGWDRLARDAVKTFAAPSSVSTLTLAAALLLPLLYPLADATNWQILSALAQRGATAEQAGRELRKTVRMYAGETALMACFTGVLGALAASATAAWRSDTPLEAFAGQITAFHNAIAEGAVALLVPGVIVAVFATMIMLCAAIFTALREALPQRDLPHATARPAARRRPPVAVLLASLIIPAAFVLAETFIPMTATKTALLVAFLVFSCSQLLPLPLVLRAVYRPAREPDGK